ncbi:hypothetical protein TTRE_0000382301 [Trichuris trichiura]|uniref:Uncharacterized protein n=1 Tax=Trichuris trichiura TaxID=36087 RepID=A0A077ZA08_TRITR|nr:hypothetical protein TTRE_0000382301 [Trichuris trichiura]
MGSMLQLSEDISWKKDGTKTYFEPDVSGAYDLGENLPEGRAGKFMPKLYINLDKWSRPRKRKVRRYMLTEDYEASLAQGSDQGPASDGEEVGALNAIGEAQTPDVPSENCSRKKSEQQKEDDEEQKEQKEEQQKEDDDDEKNEDEKAIKINESSGVF